MMRRLSASVFVLLLATLFLDIAAAQGGGAVGNAAPTLPALAHVGDGPVPPETDQTFDGEARDGNGETDLTLLRIAIANATTEWTFERPLTAADRSASAMPSEFVDGWKVWNPTAGDGRIRFQFREYFETMDIYSVNASARDETVWAEGMEVELQVGAFAEETEDVPEGATTSYVASLPPADPDAPHVAVFPDPPADSPGGLDVIRTAFNASDLPAGPLTLRADVAEPGPDVPDPPAGTQAGIYLNVSLTLEGTSTHVSNVTVTVRFTLRQAWIAANCAPPACVVKLFHYRDTPPAGWEMIDATPIGDPSADPATFESVLTSLSPVILGGFRAPGGGGGGGGGGAAAPSPSAAPLPSGSVVPTPSMDLPSDSAPTDPQSAQNAMPAGGADEPTAGARVFPTFAILGTFALALAALAFYRPAMFLRAGKALGKMMVRPGRERTAAPPTAPETSSEDASLRRLEAAIAEADEPQIPKLPPLFQPPNPAPPAAPKDSKDTEVPVEDAERRKATIVGSALAAQEAVDVERPGDGADEPEGGPTKRRGPR